MPSSAHRKSDTGVTDIAIAIEEGFEVGFNGLRATFEFGAFGP